MTPILHYIQPVKVYPGCITTLSGLNLSGNMAVKISGDSDTYLYKTNGLPAELAFVFPSVSAGKYSVSVSEYTVEDDVYTYTAWSNELKAYVFDDVPSVVLDMRNTPVRSASAYQRQIFKLWKPGQWALRAGSVLGNLLLALAEECYYWNNSIVELDKELDPTTTDDLLSNWETEYGLPDPCLTGSYVSDETLRKKQLVMKALSLGGSSPEYFKYLSSLLGVQVEITDGNAKMTTCEDTCESDVIYEGMNFVWYVDVSEYEYNQATCESDCETPLDWYNTNGIDCFFDRLRPAHTTVLLRYT